MFRALLPSRIFKRRGKEVAIQSSQMRRRGSRKISFLNSLSSSIVSLRRHVCRPGNVQDAQRERRSTKVTEEVPPLWWLRAAPLIQMQTIFFTVVLYAWLILRVMHSGMDIIWWTPGNWSVTINRSSKMMPPSPTVGFGPRCWVQRDVDRRANERCSSVHGQLKQQR